MGGNSGTEIGDVCRRNGCGGIIKSCRLTSEESAYYIDIAYCNSCDWDNWDDARCDLIDNS